VNRTDLAPLIDRAWAQFDVAKQLQACVEPSMSILFFGDLRAYETSSLRIVTVALNPSSAEFPAADRFARFPRARNIAADDHDTYLRALSEYFGPRRLAWFGHFEKFLKHLDAAYTSSPNWRCTALHTDLLTPVATKSGWSNAEEVHKSVLSTAGAELWHHLVNVLKPHLVVTSVGHEHRQRIQLPAAELPRPYALPHRSTAQWHVIGGNQALVVHGPAGSWPLPVDADAKRELARSVMGLLL